MARKRRIEAAQKEIEPREQPIPSLLTLTALREADGSEPFTVWLNALRDREARKRILGRLTVVQRGSLGTTRSVGGGVSELKIDYGRGYRVYFGQKGDMVIILIAGGDKSSQQDDISRAKDLWERYKDET